MSLVAFCSLLSLPLLAISRVLLPTHAHSLRIEAFFQPDSLRFGHRENKIHGCTVQVTNKSGHPYLPHPPHWHQASIGLGWNRECTLSQITYHVTFVESIFPWTSARSYNCFIHAACNWFSASRPHSQRGESFAHDHRPGASYVTYRHNFDSPF